MKSPIQRRLCALENMASPRRTIVIVRSIVGVEPIRMAVVGGARFSGPTEWDRATGESVEDLRTRVLADIEQSTIEGAWPFICVREFNQSKEADHAEA